MRLHHLAPLAKLAFVVDSSIDDHFNLDGMPAFGGAVDLSRDGCGLGALIGDLCIHVRYYKVQRASGTSQSTLMVGFISSFK